MTRLILLLGLAAALTSRAEEEGFVPLFNGRNLDGWVNANCAPETWSARDGVIHCTGKPTGALRTARQYENFILEVEWRHLSSGGNSGVFIWGTPIAAPGVPFLRGIEVQVLDNGYTSQGKNEWYTTHGDVFPIHGATMQPIGRHRGQRSFPSEERCKSSPAWNQYRIVATNGVLRLSVNGKEVSGGNDCNYRKGYLALESEGAPVEFRNIRIKELPSSGTPPELSAPVDLGWRSLFTGLDLRGWKTSGVGEGQWTVRNELLHARGAGPADESTLWAEATFGDVEWVVDFRPAKPAEGAQPASACLQVRGEGNRVVALSLAGAEPGKFKRYVLAVKGAQITMTQDGQQVGNATLPSGQGRREVGLRSLGGPADFMNLYARDL